MTQITKQHPILAKFPQTFCQIDGSIDGQTGINGYFDCVEQLESTGFPDDYNHRGRWFSAQVALQTGFNCAISSKQHRISYPGSMQKTTIATCEKGWVAYHPIETFQHGSVWLIRYQIQPETLCFRAVN